MNDNHRKKSIFSSPLSVPFIRCCSIFRSFVLIWCLVCFRSFSVYGTGSVLLLSSVYFSRVFFSWALFPFSNVVVDVFFRIVCLLLACSQTHENYFVFIRSVTLRTFMPYLLMLTISVKLKLFDIHSFSVATFNEPNEILFSINMCWKSSVSKYTTINNHCRMHFRQIDSARLYSTRLDLFEPNAFLLTNPLSLSLCSVAMGSLSHRRHCRISKSDTFSSVWSSQFNVCPALPHF